jgi:RNA ligase (TIGR02306 family)
MSTLFVRVVRIQEIVEHGNAESLEVAKIAGWECIVRKGQFSSGDLAVYVPIDSRIPFSLEERLFQGAKVKLDHGRIKTIKLRGRVSQGLLVALDQVPEIGNVSLGDDVAAVLGVTKYEPPEPGGDGVGPKSGKSRKQTPGFIRYTDIENVKWYNDAFKDGDLVAITEKLHGTSARFTLGPKEPKTTWEKLKKFFGFNLGIQTICGTRVMEHNEDDPFSTWAKVARQLAIRQKLRPGEIVFGEIVGYKIQKGYDYGYAPDHHGFFVYDVQVTEPASRSNTVQFPETKRFLSHEEIILWCMERGLEMVPRLYKGPFSAEILKHCTEGASVLDPENPIREGCVVRPILETQGPSSGRRILKSINPEYALKKNTEFH